MQYYIITTVCGMQIKSKPYPSRFDAMRARSELRKIALQENGLDLMWEIIGEE